MVKKFSEKDKTITITPKSANETYKYIGSEGDVHITFDSSVEGLMSQYPGRRRTFGEKNGKNLVLTTYFLNSSKNIAKIVTTTIQDFYAENSKFSQIEIYSQDNWSGYDVLSVNDIEGVNSLYVQAGAEDEAGKKYYMASRDNNANLLLTNEDQVIVADFKGNDNYTMNRDYHDENSTDYLYQNLIDDFAGNDTYTAYNSNYTYVRDFKGTDNYESYDGTDITKPTLLSVDDRDGNDKYFAHNAGKIVADDYKGNDSYTVKDSGSLVVNEYAGNDSYELTETSTTYRDEYTSATVKDYKGKDKYLVKNIMSQDYHPGYNLQIQDLDENDSYTFEKVKLYDDKDENYVWDKSIKSNDSYNISETTGLLFKDDGGNDKYTVSDCNIYPIYSIPINNLRFEDYAGSDSYEFTNVKYNYFNSILDFNYEYQNFKDADYSVYDGAGNDNYKFKNVIALKVYDEGNGKDTFNIEYSDFVHLYNVAGDDTYNIKNSATDYSPYYISDSILIEDFSGKDKYNLENAHRTIIRDYGTENDSYDLQRTNNTNIFDEGGNNTFNIKNSSVNIYSSNSIAGNDKYTYNADYNCYGINIYDIAGGKDSYSIKGSRDKKTSPIDWVYGVNIRDYGIDNDTYTCQYTNYTGDSPYIPEPIILTPIYNSSIYDEPIPELQKNRDYPINYFNSIYDEGGNDKYTLDHCRGFAITDFGNGQDSYNITVDKSNNLSIAESSEYIIINDEGGKDTYSVKGTQNEYISIVNINDNGTSNTNDADVYNIEYVHNAYGPGLLGINDEGGNNTFNIKNTLSFKITTTGEGEEKATNKYNISDSEYFKITDSQSNGKYSIKSSFGTVTDSYGTDTYELTKLTNNFLNYNYININDTDGNDKYSIDKLTGTVKIDDTQGNDTLTIGGTFKDFVFMTNINAFTEKDADCSLIAYDNKNGGFVYVKDFFDIDADYNYNGFGNGEIEDIKIGKKVDGEVFHNLEVDYNSMRADVAAWLGNNNYACVSDVLTSGNADDIAILTNAFSNHNSSIFNELS